MKILVTGASGFIGSFLVESALEQGFEVWAAVRPRSSRRWLQDPRIHFITLSFEADEPLRRALLDHKSAHGAWDYVVHAAGATKCLHEADFRRINTEGTERLARLLVETQTISGRLAFISSLSVMGLNPLADTPRPNTAYGRSKLAAEQALQSMAELDYVVLRPTGVYGPREQDYLMMAKSIRRHIDFAVGYRPQVLTFIYVRDLVQAVWQALRTGRRGAAYALTDGQEYASRDFSLLLQQELKVRGVLHITAPLCFLRLVCTVCQWWSHLTGRPATLNLDKYRIMSQRDWRADITPAIRDFGYHPEYPLARGVKETIRWATAEAGRL